MKSFHLGLNQTVHCGRGGRGSGRGGGGSGRGERGGGGANTGQLTRLHHRARDKCQFAMKPLLISPTIPLSEVTQHDVEAWS